MSGRPEITMHFGVVSQNSIGSEIVQDDSVFVVQLSHLVKRILAVGLNSTARWLTERDYLPKAGEHFEQLEMDHTLLGCDFVGTPFGCFLKMCTINTSGVITLWESFAELWQDQPFRLTLTTL